MRAPLLALAGGLVAVGAAAALIDVGGAGDGSVALGEGAGAPTATAEVAVRDLIEREKLDGTLGYGEPVEVRLAGQGTLTALPAEGSVVDRGGVIAEVDGRAIRLLFGGRPLWRPLDPGAGSGPDVRHLEENLVALGHATAAILTVDDVWTPATTAAVKRWQRANGVDESGVVSPSDVVVLPGEARIADHKATVGGPAGSGPALAVTGNEKVVTVELGASRRDLIPAGTPVEVELPDGGKVAGTVRSVSSTVTVPPGDAQGGAATVEVTIALAGGTESAFDAAPVKVLVTAAKAQGVLTVPVDALLALAEGGFAVERVRGARTEMVAVETGAFADGYVQVTGDLAAGDKVVVPR